MKIAILTTNTYPENFSIRWEESIKKNGISCDKFEIHDIDSIRAVSLDGIMCHFFHNPDEKRMASQILTSFEETHKMPIFPNFRTRWHFDDKIAQYLFLRAAGAPVVDSWIFYDKNTALDFVEQNIYYPLVFKLSSGAGSANVCLISTRKEAELIINIMFDQGIYPYSLNEFDRSKRDIIHKIYDISRYILNNDRKYILRYDQNQYQLHKNYCYFQAFLHGNEHDIRVTVIGNRAFAFTRRNRPGDFRASGSGLINYNEELVPLDAVKIAHSLSLKCNFQSMAYDFLYDNNKQLVINEISYGFQNKAIYHCPGYWDRDLKWHQAHTWPEEAHVHDFIYYIKNNSLI